MYQWNQVLDIQQNIILLFQDYNSYEFNLFSKKDHPQDARDLLDSLNEERDISDIYFIIQALRKNLIDDKGEFKKLLDYAVENMEANDARLDTTGQRDLIKAIFE